MTTVPVEDQHEGHWHDLPRLGRAQELGSTLELGLGEGKVAYGMKNGQPRE